DRDWPVVGSRRRKHWLRLARGKGAGQGNEAEARRNCSPPCPGALARTCHAIFLDADHHRAAEFNSTPAHTQALFPIVAPSQIGADGSPQSHKNGIVLRSPSRTVDF